MEKENEQYEVPVEESHIEGRFEKRITTLPAVTAALAVISYYALRWWYAWSYGKPPAVFLMPILELILWLIFLLILLISFIETFRFRRFGYIALRPIGIQLIAGLIAVFFPFTSAWLKVDFALKRQHREEIVRKVNSGRLKPNVSDNPRLIALKKTGPMVSVGGNEIVHEEHDGRKYIFFYTFRGILDNYSGFIYVPKGGNPAKFSDLEESQTTDIQPFGGHWFWVAHY